VSELAILDVAHGNSAVLTSQSAAAVFDAAPKDTVIRAIKHYNITTIDYLYLSHWDQDHVGGVANLLASEEIKIVNLIVNPDSTKGPENQTLRYLIEDAELRKGLATHVVKATSPSVNVGEVTIKVLAPGTAELYGGPGGSDGKGEPIDSNSSSVVLQLIHNEHPIVLFAADMDQRSLERILERGQSLASDILVFPHHGGHCANTPKQNELFAKQLAELVQPKVTIFSMGRTQFKNPRSEIVAAIKQTVPSTYIACTQLSTNCIAHPHNIEDESWHNHLSDLPGQGHDSQESCFGTMRIQLEGSSTEYPSSDGPHAEFIQIHIPEALCRKP
jgi:beta-lactamase superfamily II metal-dependent hydrolase